MNIKKLVITRKQLLEKITKKFYQREKVNKEIKTIKGELDSLDRVLINGEITTENILVKN